MTTDTIPEAREAADSWDNRLGKPATTLPLLITQACLAYHKRKLEECGGDVKEMVSSIQANHRDCLKLEQLLQLHTAKAVEEAQRVTKAEFNRATYLEKENATLQKQCESLQQAASINKTNIEWLNSERASLEKQCSSLETALADWHRLADQRSEALIKAQRQCEELDRELVACAKSCEEYGTKCRELRQQTGNLQQCASCGETKYTPVRLDSLGGYVCLSCVLKERDDLRTKYEEASVLCGEYLKQITVLHHRAEKAEAEVATWRVISKQYGYSKPGEMLTELRERGAEIDTLQLQLTQLQQDVKPLLHHVRIALTQSQGALDEDRLVPPHCVTSCLGMVDAFIAKHPEVKQ